MKQSIIMSLIALFLLSANGYAQKRISVRSVKQEQKEKIFEKKITYFKKNLELNEVESKNFEVAYKRYATKKNSLKKSYRKEIVERSRKEKMSETNREAMHKIIERKLELDRQLYELEAGFTKELTKILPPEKVIRYFRLERKFNHKLVTKRVKNRNDMKRRRSIMHKKSAGRVVRPKK